MSVPWGESGGGGAADLDWRKTESSEGKEKKKGDGKYN
jgi:hypothetical protein